MTNTTREVWLAVLTIALSALLHATAAPSRSNPRPLARVASAQHIIGSLADVKATSDRGQSLTVVHILDFRTDAFPGEPDLLQVRLCGDWSNAFSGIVHTDISLIFDPASPSKSTDCQPFISLDPWQDDSHWQTITPNFMGAKRSIRRANPTLDIRRNFPDN
ncbi:MAG: hypothetical protein WBV55_03680 [Candidatus Sulfotelmatobacter sp.]